ncbi:hypothetical protein AB6A40_001263 [Gnathostoma spinigerum]|uniref:Uncharacterized protein n=1 Tax=Gnathostoma spinigerum TaxID=75299 RepID=A0ABD6EB35_9BILA
MVIGDPVLVSHFSASPRALRMFPNGISGLHNNNNNNNSSSTPSNAVHNVNTSYGFGDRRRYPSEAHLSNDGPYFVSIAVVPTKDPIHHHSHHHQPQQQQQQQPSSNTSYNVSPFPRSRAFPVRLGRSAKLNRHRMGMFIPSPTSDSSSDDEFSKPSRPIHMQRRPRDLSCDPAIMRGVNRRPSFESRIYDRVAVDDSVFPFVPQPKQAIRDRESKRLQRYVVNNHAESPLNSALSYCPTYAFSNSARSASSQRRNCVRTAQMSAANIPTRNLNGVRPPSETATVESLGVNRIEPTEIYNLSDHCRLVVNSDGYYDHISSDHQRCNMDTPSSRASTVRQSSTNLQRGISPVSSGSTGSTSNILHRLRVDIDMHGRRQASSVSPSSIGPKNTVQQSHSSLESSGNDDDARQGATGHGERRDSGVGSSLSRSPSGPTTQRVRNSRLISTIYTPKNANTTNSAHRNKLFNYNILSYEDSHINGDDETFICDSDLPLCMDALSVGEMLRLRKLAFLKLSVLLDRYGGGGIRVGGGSNINSNPTVKNWAMLKLMKRIRNPENKVAKSSVSIFGLPLAIVQSKTAHALPKSILEVMQFLRVLAPETIGIFRKNGVRSRIMELRAQCDSEEGGFTNGVGLDPLQVHDIADMLKQYFRELPEPLMTTKFSETFANIFLYVPRELRMEALQYAVLLLPDENREALQTLLFFLKDVSKHAATNSMTSQNLALCFAPSLFQLTTARLNAVSPTRRHKTIGAAGMPTEKEMKESRAAQECLCVMIENCCKLFLVPHNNVFEHSNNVVGYEPDAPCLTELGVSSDGNYKTYLMQKARELLKEHRDRWKGWIVEGSVDGVEISSKKSPDGHPLRYYRVWVDVEALPKEVLLRLTKERHIWDVRVINWRRVAQLSADSCDVFQYVLNDMPSHATRDVVVVRFWRVDMKELRGGCVLVERSVRSSETQLLGGVSAAVLSSRFLIEPNAGRSRVTYVSRIDLRGRSNVWYNRVFGQLVARQLCRLRDSFGQMAVDDDGPETKV